jgi:hypothetical protein
MWTAERVAEHTGVDLTSAAQIVAIVHGELDPFTLPELEEWRQARLYEPSITPETKMRAIDVLLGTFGTEAIFGADDCMRPILEYCNAGDAYAPTILYDYPRGRYVLGTWGDWIERYGERYGVA